MNEFVSPLSDGLLRASWQGGLALALAWSLCHFAPGLTPRTRCWLWRLAYLKLILSLLWLPALPLPLLPAPTLPETSATTWAADLSGSSAAFHSMREISPPANAALFRIELGLLTAWLVGVGSGVLRTAHEWQAARGLKRQCAPETDPQIQAQFEELCQRLGLRWRPQLRIAEGAGSPLLLGGGEPTVVLPSLLCERSALPELRLMLAHELAHLKRGDLWWCWLPTLAQNLFFFHPLVWKANREWRIAQEIACDELALIITEAPAGDYGTALLKVAAQCRPNAQPGLAAVSADEFPQTLKRRLMAMKTRRPTSRRREITTGVMLALLGGILLVPWRVVAQSEKTSKVSAEIRARKEQAENNTPELIQKLNLSDAQKVRLKAIRSELIQRLQAIKATEQLSVADQKIQSEAAFTAAMQGVRAMLTPDQLRLMQDKGAMEALLMPQERKLTLEAVDGEIAEFAETLAKVGLADVQKARLQQLFVAAHNQAAALFANTRLSDEERMVGIKRLHETLEHDGMPILTLDQRKRLADIQQASVLVKINQNREEFARRLQAIGLTEAQHDRIVLILARLRDQTKVLFAMTQLSEEERTIRIKRLHEEGLSQLLSVLTPEQRQQFGEAKR